MFKKINFSSTYFKGVITIFKGFFSAQIIGLLGVFITAKLYGAAAFGDFSKFISILGILAVFFTMRLEAAIILSDTKKKTHQLFNTIFWSILLLSFTSLLLLYFLPQNWLKTINLFKFLLVAGIVAAIFKALENTYTFYLIKHKKFLEISKSKVLFTVSRYFFQIGLFFVFQKKGLIYGYIIALLILVVYFYLKTKITISKISFKTIKENLKENTNLVSFGILSDNLNTLNLHLIPLLAGIYFSNTVIGWYFLAITFLSIPLTFVNVSFSKIFFVKMSDLYQEKSKEFYPFIKKSTLYLSLILLIPLIAFVSLSHFLIDMFFSNTWGETSNYIIILSFLFYLRAIYNPISRLEEVLKKNHFGFVFNLYILVVTLLAIFLGQQQQDFSVLLSILSLGLSVGYLVMIFLFLAIAKKAFIIK